jgi:ABC-type transporter Mla subunit MlaD
MAQDRNDPLADLFTLLAAPLSGTVRSLEQFRKGVDEFLKGVENFNRAMANLNETTERINTLLAEVEEPIRAAIPQVTRTVKAADEMMQVVSGPAMAVAPGLNRLAETLSTPAFALLPHQIGQFSDLLGDVSKRLAPLTQLAESAGGLFGGFRVPGTRAPQPVAQPAPEPSSRSIVATVHTPVAPAPSPAREPVARKKPAAKRSAAKMSSAKRSSAKKSPAKKTPTKKSPAAKRTAPKR